ncbi:MAG: TrkA family potassium uptake protein [Actinomycetota bacterium]|nr:TrkA family potassium uptake protein [Actinomycetota bacterium]
MAKNSESSTVVLGLGRFGRSLAMELARRDVEVLGVDRDATIVQNLADSLTHVVSADTTDVDVLRQLGVADFGHAVVAIGTATEASILTVAALSDLGLTSIWAKATSRMQAKILERVGAHRVVLPEHEMGERVAHLVTGRMLDFIAFEDDYALVKTRTPQEAVGKSLGEARLRSKYGVTVVGIKRTGQDFTYATQDTVVEHGDVLIVAGRTKATEEFAELS